MNYLDNILAADCAALTCATQCNARIILDLLDDGARPTLLEIRRACAADGYADDLSIDLALRSLVNAGLVVRCETHGFVDYARTLARLKAWL